MPDLSAAFDTVDNDILIDRLQQFFGFKGLALSLIESFLCNRSQSVSTDEMQSTSSLLICGVL